VCVRLRVCVCACVCVCIQVCHTTFIRVCMGSTFVVSGRAIGSEDGQSQVLQPHNN